MLREFFLGFIKIHILHHAAEEPVYGLALIGELRRHGYELSPGTLYPVLHQLEEAGYLARADRVVEGKVRKYYVLTRRGRAALADARRNPPPARGSLKIMSCRRRFIKRRSRCRCSTARLPSHRWTTCCAWASRSTLTRRSAICKNKLKKKNINIFC